MKNHHRILQVALTLVALAILAPMSRAETLHAPTAPIFTIDSTGDSPDNLLDGNCATASGDCTLRAAIQEVNFIAGASGLFTLNFDIPGSGPHTIAPSSPLPAIRYPVAINAHTAEIGTACPSDSNVGSLRIILDGVSAGAASGLYLLPGSSGSAIYGLSIINFEQYGIDMRGHDNIIQCNYLGVTPDNMAAGNMLSGIRVGADNNLIGGASNTIPGRNVISGNEGDGVLLAFSANGNTIAGNLVGLDATGTAAMANNVGIYLDGADNNTIGGASAALGNFISGNANDGILIVNSGIHNDIYRNKIGLLPGGGVAGNGAEGIEISSDSNNIGNTLERGNEISGNTQRGIRVSGGNSNQINYNHIHHNNTEGVLIFGGDDNRLSYNTVEHNMSHGISILTGGVGAAGNELIRNSIYQNGAMGIDLGSNSAPEVNDPLDVDTGPNGLQNYPELHIAADDITIVGEYNSAANTSYTIEFYANGACDLFSSHGEGKTYIGDKTVTTDAAGHVDFTFFTGFDATVGNAITATATDNVTGNTSEFSQCVIVSDAFIIVSANDNGDTNPGDGVCDSYAGTTAPDCSLRAAIEEVNALAAPSKDVYFAIPGTGPFTIAPATFLPSIKEMVMLDAITYQAGASCPNGLQVEIDGSAIGGSTIDGLNLTGNSAGSTVQGLAIGNFPSSGLKLRRANITARCNYLGLRADGVTPMPNQAAGLTILADDVTVGGASAADRNVISGNASHGILIDGSSAIRNNTLIQNNYIGVDATGLAALANDGDGIRVDHSDDVDVKDNVISGNSSDGIGFVDTHGGAVTRNAIGLDADKLNPIPNQQGVSLSNASGLVIGGDVNLQLQNWISGNTYSGVRVNTGGSNTNYIQGNIIGQDFNGAPAGNGTHGVFINGGENIMVGGSSVTGNVIADNGGTGIQVLGTNTQFIILRHNNIFDNGDLGIDLNGDGVSANDPGDGDAGASQTQNFPELFNAAPSGGTTEVIGLLDSWPGGTYVVDFYRNVAADGSGYGEGETLIASMNLSNGDSQTFFFTLPTVPVGEYITAMATLTDPSVNSSEFSAAIQVSNCTPPPSFDPAIAIAGSDVQLTWSSPSSVDFYVFRSVDDPYFIASETYDETTASLWTDPAADELGDAANNYYYYVRGADGCASTPGQTVGEFDFALTPGTP